KVHTTGAPFHLDKIEQDRLDTLNEFLTYFGVNNININKKERLITNEANANDELIAHNRNKMLKPRKEAAHIISELWGTDITVDVNEEVVDLIRQQMAPLTANTKEGESDGDK